MLVKIRRQECENSASYWQSFAYDGDKNITVGALLDELNGRDELLDAEGKPARRIQWECSCLQKTCGACAMVINGVPALACGVFLRDMAGDTLTVEPLTKFPVLSDLKVDRGVIPENLKKAEVYLGTYRKISPADFSHLYSVARCLKCGLCLEVCPNYHRGENFFGAGFANESFLMAAQTADRERELKRAFSEYFAKGCSKALACEKICPMGIETLSSIARMSGRPKSR